MIAVTAAGRRFRHTVPRGEEDLHERVAMVARMGSAENDVSVRATKLAITSRFSRRARRGSPRRAVRRREAPALAPLTISHRLRAWANRPQSRKDEAIVDGRDPEPLNAYARHCSPERGEQGQDHARNDIQLILAVLFFKFSSVLILLSSQN